MSVRFIAKTCNYVETGTISGVHRVMCLCTVELETGFCCKGFSQNNFFFTAMSFKLKAIKKRISKGYSDKNGLHNRESEGNNKSSDKRATVV